MKSSVVNLQRTVSVNVPLLDRNLRRIKKAMGLERFSVDLKLRSDKMVQQMNNLDRNVNQPTDVLSYASQRIVPGTLPKVTTKTKYLGELIFGMGYIRSYCEEEGKDLDEHLERLAVHGLCHLIGYDHESKEEYELMRNMEHGVLKKVKELKEAEEKEQTQQAILSADVESLPSASQISPPTSNKPVAKPTSPSTKSATASGKKRTTKKKREATNFPASALQPNKPPSL